MLRPSSMRIGLMRHFPVTEPLPKGWLTEGDLAKWRQRYDAAEVVVGPYDLGGVEWKSCLSSDLSRAASTAAHVFSGRIFYTSLLREPELGTFNTGRLRLPLLLWKWFIRLAWAAGFESQKAKRDEFRSHVSTMADQLEERTEDTLVVCHAVMMLFLSQELERRGYNGPKLKVARHAVTYVYER